MIKISIRNNFTLSVLAVFSLLSFLWVENSKVIVKQKWYNEKLMAAKLMEKAEQHIKQTKMENGIFLDNINDPNETAMIGQEFTQITTGRGSLPIKLSTTNPNFAALVVELFKEAGLKEGDKVAVCMTGSFPALNIATYAAIQTLNLDPIIILSTTSSSWGANNPNFTWIDMQTLLYHDKIFMFHALATSIGGNQDIGRALSIKGRELAKKAIERNNLTFIDGINLTENIKKRMEIIKGYSDNDSIKMFVNVGGGVASLGTTNNGSAIPSGLNMEIKLKKIPDKIGVAFQMAQRKIPITHLLHLKKLMKKYNLPMNPVPLPKPGESDLFQSQKYNLLLVGILTAILMGIIIFIILKDKKEHALGTEIINEEL